MKRGPWIPLLEGGLALAARQAVADIASDLGREVRARNGSLAEGHAGQALFHGYLARFTGEEKPADLSARSLDAAIDALAEGPPMHPGLYGGFTGVAWAAEHLAEGAPDEESEEDAGAEIDAAVQTLLAPRPWRETYDLIRGLVGLGVYALERLPRPAARTCLAGVVAHLLELAEPGPGGVTWFTPPDLLGPWALSVCPQGRYDLGVAHGVPAALALLADAHRLGLLDAAGFALLEGAVGWLLAQKMDGNGPCFASWIAPGTEPQAARLAWCYGDAGIAATLLYAARAAARPDWETEALEIALRAASRPMDQSGVADAGLCHGARSRPSLQPDPPGHSRHSLRGGGEGLVRARSPAAPPRPGDGRIPGLGAACGRQLRLDRRPGVPGRRRQNRPRSPRRHRGRGASLGPVAPRRDPSDKAAKRGCGLIFC